MYRGHSAEHQLKLLVAMSKVSYLISRVHMGTCVTPLTEKWREDFLGGWEWRMGRNWTGNAEIRKEKTNIKTGCV